MAYSANDSFCAITDVEAVVGRGAYSGTTAPTSQQVLDWMARRGSEIEERMARWGLTYTVPSRSNPFGTPTGDTGKRLKIACEAANAQGAAADAILMHSAKSPDGAPESVKVLLDQYEAALKAIDALCQALVSTSTSAPATLYETKTDGLEFTIETTW